MKQDQHIHLLLRYLLPIYLLVLVLLTFFRGLFVYLFYEDFILLYHTTDELYPILLTAFAKGFRYDAIVVSYAMAVPLIALIVLWIFSLPTKLYLIFSKIYIIVVFTLIFALSCMDFPYFKYFWTHPTVSIFNWAGFGGTYGMLLQETDYYPYYALFLFIVFILVFTIYFLCKKLNGESRLLFLENKIVQIVLFSLASLFCFWGTKGHMHTEAIGLTPVMFTKNKLVINLCLPPSYYFAYHFNEKDIKYDELMPSETAIRFVKEELNIQDNPSFNNPLSRAILADSLRISKKYNVVLILMESMSSEFMNREVNGIKLTPFLDSLAEVSYYFNNFYSSGIHTNAGIASTLSGYTSRFSETMMGRTPPAYKGLGTTLKENEYYNTFFISHNEVFDNTATFINKNGFDRLYSESDYPKEKIVSYLGVQDDYLFQYALKEINTTIQHKQPFFSNILTISNHPPRIIPERFKNIGVGEDDAILLFADTSIKEFMKEASKEDWYQNTIFVLLGDHGAVTGKQIYNMPLSNNHIPLIIYSPAFADIAQHLPNFGCQVDVFPTIMGLLNLPYINNGLGVDLLKDKRAYAFFTSDTSLGCIDGKYFYTFNPKDGNEALYDIVTKDGIDILHQHRETANKMKDYAVSMIVTTNSLEHNRQVEQY